MMKRSYNKESDQYRNYGGRGIRVCFRWHKLKDFLKDVGKRPAGMTLERKNNDGNYCPSNCKWATRLEQGNNKRTNRILEFNGKKQSVAMWARELSIPSGRIFSRLKSGWTVTAALGSPSHIL